MVTTLRRLGIFLLLGLRIASADPVTADELRALSMQGVVQADQRAVRARALHLQSVLPAPQSHALPQIRKYETEGAAGRSAPIAPARQAGEAAQPPDSGAIQAVAIATDAVPVATNRHFGISLGAWIHVTLAHSLSSADPGYAEFLVTRPLVGTSRTLPVGTKLFAQKEYNQSTQRLEFRVVKGITPSGHEFAMQGLIYDPAKMAGLPGVVSGNARQVARQGLGTGILAAGSAAISQLGAGSVMGSAVSAGTNSVLSNTGQWVDQSTQSTITIYVSPQRALIQVGATF